jgi:trk system potassium uptake protein TrkH
MFLGVVTVSWFFFLLYGYDPLNALFEVVSATGTVGLSAGVTNAAMPDFLKGILCLDMLMGRLEILAWLVIFYPRTWIGKRMEES